MAYKVEDFDVLNFIGQGSFASCFKIRNKHTHEVLLWKVIEYGGVPEDKKQLLVTEVSLLRDLRHPNIVSYYGRIVCKESKRLYIIIEYCPGGDLATLIKTCQRSQSYVDENFIWRVLHQLSSALHACHSWLSSSVVLHRDIKPANVFLDEKGNIKLGDFGLACKLDISEIGCVETMVGTPFYMSPEVMKGEIYNSKSDVWSLGCLVYELCALSPPFNAQNIKELSAKISRGRFPRIPSHYSDKLQSILSSLLVVNQEHRPSVFDVVCHPVILSHLHPSVESICTKHCVTKPLLKIATNNGNSSPNVTDRDPQKVSKDTFRSEWMARLQSLRDREAILRCREQQLDEREHSVLKREHKVALMERMVRDKMVLAEVYLKRSRDCRQGGGTTAVQFNGMRQPTEEFDESFSADAGDTSVMPTSTLLDPALIPKPSFSKAPPARRVHFNDEIQPNSAALIGHSKPLFLKVAEAIRNNRCKLDAQSKPVVQQKVLHFPGYTGPAITVNVPINEDQDVVSGTDAIESQLTNSPPVKFTVLFDDREDLRKATHGNKTRLEALNLETNDQLKGLYGQKSSGTSPDVEFHKQMSVHHSNDSKSTLRKIGASVDSLLDASLTKKMSNNSYFTSNTSCDTTSKHEKTCIIKNSVSPTENILKRSAFGGSLRYRRRSIRSNSTSSNESKFCCENQTADVDNIRNDALLLLQEEFQVKPNTHITRKKNESCRKGKENILARDASQRGKIPHVPTGSSVISQSQKAQTLFLR